MYLRGLKGRAASSVAVGAAVAQGRLKSCRIAWLVSCCIDSTCGRARLLSSCGRATFILAIASDLHIDALRADHVWVALSEMQCWTSMTGST